MSHSTIELNSNTELGEF